MKDMLFTTAMILMRALIMLVDVCSMSEGGVRLARSRGKIGSHLEGFCFDTLI